MRYAFNTWCDGSFPVWVPSYPLDDVIRRLARIGYDRVEIGCAAPHLRPAHLSSERCKEVRSPRLASFWYAAPSHLGSQPRRPDKDCRHAAGKGVTIAVEPISADTNLVESADDALELMRASGQPNVKVMSDTYHALYRSADPDARARRSLSYLNQLETELR